MDHIVVVIVVLLILNLFLTIKVWILEKQLYKTCDILRDFINITQKTFEEIVQSNAKKAFVDEITNIFKNKEDFKK